MTNLTAIAKSILFAPTYIVQTEDGEKEVTLEEFLEGEEE